MDILEGHYRVPLTECILSVNLSVNRLIYYQIQMLSPRYVQVVVRVVYRSERADKRKVRGVDFSNQRDKKDQKAL